MATALDDTRIVEFDVRTDEMLVNMGPQHPSTHGVLRVVLKLDGEKVVDLDPVLGYLHRGVEKLCENADYHQVISQVDPLEYISSLFNEWGAVLSFEKLLDLDTGLRSGMGPPMTYRLDGKQYIAVAAGGSINQLSAWQHFIVMSNMMQSPKVLLCPSDKGKQAAGRGSGHSEDPVAGGCTAPAARADPRASWCR